MSASNTTGPIITFPRQCEHSPRALPRPSSDASSISSSVFYTPHPDICTAESKSTQANNTKTADKETQLELTGSGVPARVSQNMPSEPDPIQSATIRAMKDRMGRQEDELNACKAAGSSVASPREICE
jgi:hypothetical protein